MADPVPSLADRLSGASEPMLREIIRNGESYLGAQLASGLASNQRAMTITSMLGAATVVLGGAAGSLITGAMPRLELGCVCAATALGFLIAMAYAISAAKPAPFEYSGNTPSGWAGDVEQGKTLQRSLAEQASWYAEMIATNNVTMERSDKRLVMCLKLAWTSLALGGVSAIAAVIIQNMGW